MRVALLLVVLCAVAHAQDPFEIQVYDTDTAHRGEAGLEIHINEHLYKTADDQTHTTFEPHYGLRDWLELGGYLQSSVSSGEAYQFAGAKLRLKARLPTRYWQDRIGFGINGELAIVPREFEGAVYGSEIRPIVELRAHELYAAFNPILAIDLSGDVAGHPQFEPCAKVAWWFTPRFALGVEGYGGFGPVNDLGAEKVERGFATIDIRARAWDVDFGVGVNHGSEDHPVLKLIFGIHP
jgi:hypothetical protein